MVLGFYHICLSCRCLIPPVSHSHILPGIFPGTFTEEPRDKKEIYEKGKCALSYFLVERPNFKYFVKDFRFSFKVITGFLFFYYFFNLAKETSTISSKTPASQHVAATTILYCGNGLPWLKSFSKFSVHILQVAIRHYSVRL